MNEIQQLDLYLQQTINYLISNWYQEETGIVASALKDGNKIVFSTSSRNGNNWSHAERNAYNKFVRLYGQPSRDAVFITTFSPCIEKLKYRAEPSCAELIKSLGIKRIHFGVLDTLHAATLDAYTGMGFVATIAENTELAAICKNLMSLFERYDSKINTELLKIKNELGDSIFSNT